MKYKLKPVSASQDSTSPSTTSPSTFWALALGALGIVFGDIGTSPLYAFRECFSPQHGLVPNHDNVLGTLSLIFWTLAIVICFKYMLVVLRADNKGEGGILSLMTLAIRSLPEMDFPRQRSLVLVLGLIGACLLFGESIITPVISVLGALEGVKYVTPVLDPYIVPIAVFILNAFFLMQRFGTSWIGWFFGPIILVWFAVLAVLGAHGISSNPGVLEAVNPVWGVRFLANNGWFGFLVLGAVFLVVTGGEALYADIGHFGKKPIRRAWFFVVFPALVLNYFGQGALLLMDPAAISNPFFLLAPSWGTLPLVILSVLAAIIASQALVSGIFSVARQAIQLGFWPRLSIIYTSNKEAGQVYIPFFNWAMFAGTIWLTLHFRTSSNLAAAYGISVTGTMVITTILAFVVSRRSWKWSLSSAGIVFGFFLLVDLAFFSSNLTKISYGGWVLLVLGGVVYLLMIIWQKGWRILYQCLKEKSIFVEEFCVRLLKRLFLWVLGIAIYMSGDFWGVFVFLLHNLKHN